jgi:hypothetical protein
LRLKPLAPELGAKIYKTRKINYKFDSKYEHKIGLWGGNLNPPYIREQE